MVSMCNIDVREGPERLVMIAATLQDISRKKDRGTVPPVPPPTGRGFNGQNNVKVRGGIDLENHWSDFNAVEKAFDAS